MPTDIRQAINPRDVFQKALDNLSAQITAGKVPPPTVSESYMTALEFYVSQQISFAIKKAYGHGYDEGREELKEQMRQELAIKLEALNKKKKPAALDF